MESIKSSSIITGVLCVSREVLSDDDIPMILRSLCAHDDASSLWREGASQTAYTWPSDRAEEEEEVPDKLHTYVIMCEKYFNMH